MLLYTWSYHGAISFVSILSPRKCDCIFLYDLYYTERNCLQRELVITALDKPHQVRLKFFGINSLPSNNVTVLCLLPLIYNHLFDVLFSLGKERIIMLHLFRVIWYRKIKLSFLFSDHFY